uniref:Uncharacterized protein n=1 Tax=Streptomyces violaceusniger TaxID=68280 RepID=A0A6F8Z2I6_STRVO|nr:hypothetical protein [Streptomyces violaceusniger]
MDTNGTTPVADLLHWRGELPSLIKDAYAAETPAFLTRAHAAAATSKLLTGRARPDELTDWAQAVEFLEDLDFEAGQVDLLTQFLIEISTPELFEPITVELCRRWHHRLTRPTLPSSLEG